MARRGTSAGAGVLRERVTIQRKVVSRDGYGAEQVTWQDVATVWARVEVVKGREVPESRQMDVMSSHRVTMRYRTDVDETMRLMWRGRVLHIVALIPDERRRYLAVLAEEHVM